MSSAARKRPSLLQEPVSVIRAAYSRKTPLTPSLRRIRIPHVRIRLSLKTTSCYARCRRPKRSTKRRYVCAQNCRACISSLDRSTQTPGNGQRPKKNSASKQDCNRAARRRPIVWAESCSNRVKRTKRCPSSSDQTN